MLLIRFILLGLASLNCAWALSNFLTEYLRFVIQSLDSLRYAAPFDPASLIAWLAVALASGMGAFMLLRASYQEQRRVAQILVLPAPTQPTDQEPGAAA